MPYAHVPAYLLLLATQNPNVLPNGSVFEPMTAPTIYRRAGVVSTPAYDLHNICGSCGNPATQHYSEAWLDTNKPAWDQCNLPLEFVADCRSYGDPDDKRPSEVFEHADRYGLPQVDYSGPGTTDDMESEDQYESDVTFTDDSTYFDKYPLFSYVQGPPDEDGIPTIEKIPNPNGEQTGILVKTDKGYECQGLRLGSLDDVQKSFFVEGDAGYVSHKAYDDNLTRLYQARLLNVFKDQPGYLRIGSIRFASNKDGSVTATCVQNSCSGKIHLDLRNHDESLHRSLMEQFIFNCIRHGNNHAARFITSRSDWYKIHSQDCDLNCTGLACNANSPRLSKPESLSNQETLEFLMEHKSYCHTSNCKCDDWIKAMLTALLESNHNLKVSA